MRKRILLLGVVLLGLCLCLSASAQSQSNEPVEFVKLLNEAENSFLDEDYAQAKTALGKAQEILERQIGLVQGAGFFFDLSTPENALRSFLEASFLGNEETAKKCWSKRIPDYLISITASAMQEEKKEEAQEKPELVEPEMLKLIAKAFRYEKQWTGMNSYYVWATAPGEERSESMQCRLVKEDGHWKVLGFKVWEEEDWFKALIEKE